METCTLHRLVSHPACDSRAGPLGAPPPRKDGRNAVSPRKHTGSRLGKLPLRMPLCNLCVCCVCRLIQFGEPQTGPWICSFRFICMAFANVGERVVCLRATQHGKVRSSIGQQASRPTEAENRTFPLERLHTRRDFDAFRFKH